MAGPTEEAADVAKSAIGGLIGTATSNPTFLALIVLNALMFILIAYGITDNHKRFSAERTLILERCLPIPGKTPTGGKVTPFVWPLDMTSEEMQNRQGE